MSNLNLDGLVLYLQQHNCWRPRAMQLACLLENRLANCTEVKRFKMRLHTYLQWLGHILLDILLQSHWTSMICEVM